MKDYVEDLQLFRDTYYNGGDLMRTKYFYTDGTIYPAGRRVENFRVYIVQGQKYKDYYGLG